MIGVLTNKENSLVKGLKVESDETKTLRFNQSYQLIGFKGLGSADSLDSLGAIMFDTTCDVNNPQGAKLRVPSLDAFEVSPAKEQAVTDGQDIISDITDESSDQENMTIILVACAIGLLVIIATIVLLCCLCRKKKQTSIDPKKVEA